MSGVRLFYSYSHKDEHFRNELEAHLAVLRKNGFIREWHDRRIAAGSDWEEAIDQNLEAADVILLLVSSDFLASDYCYDTETIRALDKQESGESIVVPILLRPCLWVESKLSRLQALPRDNKPISSHPDRDEAWLAVVTGILEQIRKKFGDTPAPSAPKALVVSSATLEPDEVLITRFLTDYRKWYFSPLRIQKWGGQQIGFEALAALPLSQIRKVLEKLRAEGKVKTTVSQRGNTIFKADIR